MDHRYEIRDKLGEGGVGVVYEAWDRQLSRRVAIKRLLPAATALPVTDDAAMQSLLREAALLSSMQHPNIVVIFDAGVDEEGAYVVMEFIEGDLLREVVNRGPLIQDDFVRVVEQTLDALVSAHHHDLLHRDIKPRNLILRWLPSDSFQVKLLDFGLAKYSPEPSQQTMAYEDTIMGSSAYMAPEQFEHGLLDARTDLYQMGCVYYFALSGELPFDGETAADVMESHLQHRVTPLEDIRPDLPEAVTTWVMKLIERYPNDRPSSAKEALLTFREACSHPSTSLPALSLPIANGDVSPPEPSPHRGWLHAASALVGGLLGGFIWWGIADPNKETVASRANPSPPPSPISTITIDASDRDALEAHLGDVVTVRGRVTRAESSRRGTTFLHFPGDQFTVVSFPSDRSHFPKDPLDLYADTTIAITGRVEAYNRQFQIKLRHPDHIRVLDFAQP